MGGRSRPRLAMRLKYTYHTERKASAEEQQRAKFRESSEQVPYRGYDGGGKKKKREDAVCVCMYFDIYFVYVKFGMLVERALGQYSSNLFGWRGSCGSSRHKVPSLQIYVGECTATFSTPIAECCSSAGTFSTAEITGAQPGKVLGGAGKGTLNSPQAKEWLGPRYGNGKENVSRLCTAEWEWAGKKAERQ